MSNTAIQATDKIYVAGHKGLVGSALVRRLRTKGFSNIVTRTHDELDLTSQVAVTKFFDEENPALVFLAAARVGGILANSNYPAEFIQQNLAIQTNVLHQAWRSGVKRMLFLGSSCIYPRECPQPIKERYLLTGPLELTNRPYAIAKIAGIEMCSAYNRQYGTGYLAVMPTNLYGPEDRFDLQASHVLPALIRKAHEAKVAGRSSMVVLGSGRPRREFLYVDDMADACVHLAALDEDLYARLLTEDPYLPLINIGYGSDLTIRELSELIARVIGFEGELTFDASAPDGTPRKLLDSSRMLALGWRPSTSLGDGIARTYEGYLTRLGDLACPSH